MLVLTRRVGQELIVDGNIRVTVKSIQGSRVKIGITAPRDVTIRRTEQRPLADGLAENAADLPPVVADGISSSDLFACP